MAQNKLENQMREKLNSREIKPTEMAWDRLDAMLSVAEEKKTKRSLGWLYIAASILVFLSFGIYFFNQNTIEINPENSVVIKEGENVNNKINDNHNGNVPSINKQEEQVALSIKNQKSAINNQQSSKSFNPINQKATINPNQENQNNNQEVIVQNTIPAQSVVTKIEENTIQVKPQIDDIEALLASASKSNKNQKADAKIKISSSSLLAQVDGEVEMTFREKVLKKVTKNYEEIKVAVTTRNTISESNSIKNNYK